MSTRTPTLHLLCGKIAAGKSTLAGRLAAADHTVLISEDMWLAALYSDAIKAPKDYQRCSEMLCAVMGPHVATLLGAGVSVVLDFPANTARSRVWMREILDTTDAAHQFHVLVPPDEVCLARLRTRNASGTHPFQVSEAQFHQIGAHFIPPSQEEGFNLIHHDQAY